MRVSRCGLPFLLRLGAAIVLAMGWMVIYSEKKNTQTQIKYFQSILMFLLRSHPQKPQLVEVRRLTGPKGSTKQFVQFHQ